MEDIKKYFINIDSEEFDVYISKIGGTCEFTVKDDVENCYALVLRKTD